LKVCKTAVRLRPAPLSTVIIANPSRKYGRSKDHKGLFGFDCRQSRVKGECC